MGTGIEKITQQKRMITAIDLVMVIPSLHMKDCQERPASGYHRFQ